jgi:uncharacterized protein
MTKRLDVEFDVEGGDRLRGWLFVPEGVDGPRPAISMAHRYAAVRELGIEPFARAFAEAGFVVLLHDHRIGGSFLGKATTSCLPFHWTVSLRQQFRSACVPHLTRDWGAAPLSRVYLVQ